MIWLDMHFSPIIKMDGTLVGIPSFSKDISERKEREQLITQWKNGWIGAVETITYLLAVTGTSHRIQRANAAVTARPGSSVRDAVGLSCHQNLRGTSDLPPF